MKDRAKRVADCAFALRDQSEAVAPSSRLSADDTGDMLRIGIGISRGEVIHGRFKFDVWDGRGEITGIGAAINKAQRLCEFAQKYGVVERYGYSPAIVVDEEVQMQIALCEDYVVRRLDKVSIRGFTSPQEPMGTYLYSLNKKQELVEPDTAANKKYLYLSYGLLSSPSNFVVSALPEYYDEVRQVGPESIPSKPESTVALEVAGLMACNPNNVGFRANTTGCLASGLSAIIDKIQREFAAREKPRGGPDRELRIAAFKTDLDHPSVSMVFDNYLHWDAIDTRVISFLPNSGVSTWTADTVVQTYVNEVTAIAENGFDCCILIIPHISWSTGLRLPFGRITRSCREILGDRLWVIVDGAHSLGHVSIGLDNLVHGGEIDFYATCGHKWLGGPQGTGIYWSGDRLFGDEIARRRLSALDTLTHRVGMGATAAAMSAQTGTGQRATAYALLRAIAEYKDVRVRNPVSDAGIIAIRENQVMEQSRGFIDNLKNFKESEIELFSPEADELRCGIVCFQVKGLDNHAHGEIKNYLDELGIFLTFVDHDVFGLRVCISHDTSSEDLDVFLGALSHWFKANGRH